MKTIIYISLIFFEIFFSAYIKTNAQCICTLPGYGCHGTGDQHFACVLGCANFCNNPQCLGGATISANDSLNFYVGDSVVLTAHRVSASAYQWMNDTMIIVGETSQNYVASSSGTYRCKVTNSCGTKLTPALTVTVSMLLGINGYEELQYFSVYPNPFSHSTTIHFYIMEKVKISLKLFDINSRLVKIFSEMEFSSGEHKLEWNDVNAEAGIYFLNIQLGNSMQMKKLIITN